MSSNREGTQSAEIKYPIDGGMVDMSEGGMCNFRILESQQGKQLMELKTCSISAGVKLMPFYALCRNAMVLNEGWFILSWR